ncbi:hypothetical protein [Reichenbachiella sp.]|uniref:hypothetical protein n=1 Tax=Reichenbachiella sp. TaxID=2184521 RepID=UPI003BB0E998
MELDHKVHEKREGLFAGLAVFIILEFLTYFIYLNAINAQKGEILEGLYRTAYVIRTLIDEKQHQLLDCVDQEEFPIYLDQIEPLYRALNVDSSIEFIYTMIQKDSTIHFILDPTPPGQYDKKGIETKSHIMNIYKDPSNELKKCFDTHKKSITHKAYNDQWGSHISCYLPLFDEKKFIGVLGVDISSETYNNRLEPIKKATQRTMVTIFFIAYLSGMIIWFLRRLQKEICGEMDSKSYK